MRTLKVLKVLSAVVLLVALFLTAAQAQTPARAMGVSRSPVAPVSTGPGAGCSSSGWRVIPGVNPDATSTLLNSVAAVSSSDVWAVGQSGTRPGVTLTEQWNGSKWQVIPSANQGTSANQLLGVGVVSASDIWAVGDYWDLAIDNFQTLGEHWDGAKWTIFPTPSPTELQNELVAVAGVSSSDVWAVGSYSSFNGALIEHWNGTNWTVSTISNAGANGSLTGVAAISANDVWAVGSYQPMGATTLQTLVEHWNGTSWQLMPSPSVASVDNDVTAITAIGASDVWMVGYTYDSQTGINQALAEHWNGAAWSIVPTPDPMSGDVLSAVTAASSTDVWAGGNFFDHTTGAQAPYFEHWNGATWTAVYGVNVGAGETTLGMAAVSARDVWAVGIQTTSTATQTLVEHYTWLKLGIRCS